jgi:carbamoyl-phosphate synthase large subunit
MPTPLLLTATATRWFGTARVPRALANAGFEVSLLTPRPALAQRSGHLSRIEFLPDHATPRQWMNAFTAIVEATRPRIVVPCDDTAFRLLAMLAQTPPDDMDAARAFELSALITESLGDPAFFRTSVDKTLLSAAAEALGVRVPRHARVRDVGEARAFADAHGFPIVLKRAYTSAGDYVAIVENRAALGPEFAKLLRAPVLDIEGVAEVEIVVQEHIPGPIVYYAIAAWKSELICSWAADRLVAAGDAKGPSSVVRYRGSPELETMAAKLVRGFNISGLLGLETIEDARNGKSYLIEINRRVTPGTHRGDFIGADQCAALYAAIHGLPARTRARLDDGETHISVHFPQEWLRDPESDNLRRHPVDVPWDEPELFEAMVALARERE